MLYLYDNAIVDDLKKSFNNEISNFPVIKAVTPDEIIGIAAQIKEDSITFPTICVVRSPNYQIDTQRTNFTAMHKGSVSVFDNKTNNIYHEKVLPITLDYTLTVLTTNTADMDEIIRELLFKYISMYFLTIKLPYEADRNIHIGIRVDTENIERQSSTSEYLASGALYETMIPLKVEGAVLVNYTPVKLKRVEYSINQE